MDDGFAFFDIGGNDQDDDLERGPWYQRRDKWVCMLLDDHGAPPVPKVIGVRLTMMCHYRRRWCQVSYDTLAKTTGHGEKSIRRAIKWLEETGYINIPQRGGTDMATGATWSNIYSPNFHIADEFADGANNRQGTGGQNDRGTGGQNDLVYSDNGGSLAADPSAAASGPPRAPKNSPKLGFPESEFSEFLALVERHNKLGDAGRGEPGYERVRCAYAMALSRPGVTAGLLYSKYEAHLIERKGKRGKHAGHYVLRWLNNPWTYVPSNDAENQNTGHSATESLGPGPSTRETPAPIKVTEAEATAARAAIRDNPTAKQIWSDLEFVDPADAFRSIKEGRAEYVTAGRATPFTLEEIPDVLRMAASYAVQNLITGDDEEYLKPMWVASAPSRKGSVDAECSHPWEAMVPLMDSWNKRLAAWQAEQEDEVLV